MNTITVNYSEVTSAMIGSAHKVFGPDNKPFYKVENSKGEVDADGSIKEYTVKAIRKNNKWHVTCDCKAGNEGRQCWHKRASVAAAAEEKQALAEQVTLNEAAKVAEQEEAKQRAKLIINGKPATKEEYDRVMNAKPKIDRKAKAPQARAFSLMK